MLAKIVSGVTILAAVTLGYVVSTTTPTTIGPLGILFVFVLLYLLLLGCTAFFIYGVMSILHHFTKESSFRKPIKKLSFKKSYYLASVIALAPVMLVGAQSIGRSSFYDIALVLIFEVIALIYMSRR